MATRTIDKKIKYLTVADGGCYKSFGSLPIPKNGRNVQSMDSLTARELEGSIVYDSSTAAHALGHTIDVIFASFPHSITAPIFTADSLASLTIPFDTIPSPVLSSFPFTRPSPADWSLYDPVAQRWRWSFEPPSSLSKSYKSKSSRPTHPRPPSSEQMVADFFNSIAVAVSDKAPGLFQNNTKRHWRADWSYQGMPGSTGYIRKPDLVLVDNSALAVDEIDWGSPRVLAEYTKESFQPAKRLGKTMDSKAYLTFLEQPWRRFVLGLSISNGTEFRLHFYDRSGGAISPSFDIHANPDRLIYILCAVTFGCRGCLGFDVSMTIKPVPARIRGLLKLLSRDSANESVIPSPSVESLSSPLCAANEVSPAIGTMRVGDDLYEIVDMLFSSQGFLGRGTVCYLTRRDDVLYVIKDHWVRLSPHRELLNEVKVMEQLRGIPGVPNLDSHWVVIADSVEDRTERYREEEWRVTMKARRVHLRLVITPYARPLTAFKSKRELVSCLRDILTALQRAADLGIIHRDCSLNNTSIEDLDKEHSRGLLLDWEFGAAVNESERYTVGGTGTLPYMSVNLLDQIRKLVKKEEAGRRSIRKTLSNTRVFLDDNITVKHTHSDDIESLFYVLVWIMILYDGPLSSEREDVEPEATVLGRWSDDAVTNLTAASDAKSSLLLRDSRWDDFHEQVSPYFTDLLPLADGWRKVVADGVRSATGPGVRFSDVLSIFDEFLPTMPVEKPAEIAKAIQGIRGDYVKFVSSITLPVNPDSDPAPESEPALDLDPAPDSDSASELGLPYSLDSLDSLESLNASPISSPADSDSDLESDFPSGSVVPHDRKRIALSEGIRSLDNLPQANKRFRWA